MNNEQRDRVDGMNTLKPCPFCGEDFCSLPEVMVIERACHEDYIAWLKENGKFSGTDNYYVVHCHRCGVRGARGVTKEQAVKLWNRRSDE